MLSRLLWRIVTPRKLRRITLVILLLWLAGTYLHHSGTAEQLREDLPRQVQIELPTAVFGNGDPYR